MGSLLETIASTRNLKYIFCNQKLSITVKTRVFNCYVESIVLYNSELWTLTETKKKQSIQSKQKDLEVDKGLLEKNWWKKKSTWLQFDLGLGNRND